LSAFVALFPTLGGALVRSASVKFLRRVAQTSSRE
jgi:hypothetical protein